MKSHPWTKQEIEKLVNLTLDGVGPHDIAARLHRASNTIRNMQLEVELITTSSLRRRWTRKEIATLRKQYSAVSTAKLAARLGKTVSSLYGAATKYGLKKSAEYLRSAEACILRRDPSVGEKGRFKPGIIPHNKGTRRPGWSVGRMRETQFKKGQRPHTWRPIGSTRTNDGYHQTKITDTGYPPRDWICDHVLLWQDMHGPIPAGHCLVFRDGKKDHIAIDNLELLSRKQLMARNTIHKLPEDLVRVIQLNGALKRTLRGIDEKQTD